MTVAALGTIPVVLGGAPPTTPAYVPITDYDVNRGSVLGTISTIAVPLTNPPVTAPLTDYVVRQLRVLYRQLWPSHGQRFPQ